MNEETERNTKRTGSGKTQLLAIILIVILALGAGFGGGVAALRYMTGSLGPGPGPDIAAGDPAQIRIEVREDVTVAEAIAQKVLPSVVGISTVTEQEGGSFFGFGNGYTYDAQSVGTGVIVDEEGYILTNSHVVNDGNTKSLTVSLFDGSDVDGTVLWSDATLDLAVVKVEAPGLVAAELGDSDEVSIGAYAAAIGNPLGLAFERSMSQGIISGLNRSIEVGGGGGSSGMEGLMQTDATINSGNSGGPLLNSRGQVIGINTAKAASGEGMGFAIPVNVAKPILEQIMERGTFTRAYIGITGIGLEEQTYYSPDELMEEFGADTGIYVASVVAGGGAQEAGLREGDVIVRVEGKEVGTMNRLNTLLVAHRPGDQAELTVMRDRKEQTFRVTLTDGNTSLQP